MKAKAVLFLLTQNPALADGVIAHFEKTLGPVALRGDWHLFEKTYYEEELGPDLKRCVVGFKNPFQPWHLAELKRECIKIESGLPRPLRGLAMTTGRKINIDPGYVDLFKVVLASGKGGGQKICIAENIHAHTLLRYEKGGWIPFEWTFPDFKADTYHGDLLKIRRSLKESVHEKRRGC
ncbi:MAG: DUF4416 family protein [Deltaproteobacteria bacterium]|nr:DUF4416 family protein [Deltaproteobacteria bacterium]